MHNIADISKGGLSFHCAVDVFFPVQWPIEIIYTGTLLYMKGVQVQLVREELEEPETFITPPTKAIAVSFLELDSRNQQMLEELLSYHTGGQA
jgi:hypothetical protein